MSIITCSVDPLFVSAKIKYYCTTLQDWETAPFFSLSDKSPQGLLVGIHPLRAKGSESSSWAKQPTSSPVTDGVIAKPVRSLSWLDPPVPLDLFQGERMGARMSVSKGMRNRVEFSESL